MVSKPAYILVFIGKPVYKTIYLALLLLRKIFSAFFILPRTILSCGIQRLLFLITFLYFTLVFVFFGLWAFLFHNLPRAEDLIQRDVELSTKIYDRNGVLLYQIYKDKNRSRVKLTEIPLNVKLATLAAEDANFYSHHGFSIKGITRALGIFLDEGKVTGGSTITQQLVKNALLTPEKTLKRKAREILLAIDVERKYSKDEILEMYLNEVPYGGSIYGIKEASRVYFDKDVSELTLSEAALLAGLPKSPTLLSPFGNNPELSIQRQNEVIDLMVSNEFITFEEAEKAKKEKLVFSKNKTEIKAPHFVMYVKDQLVNKYGESMVLKGGLKIVTTLDYKLQKRVEEIVKNEVESIRHLNVSNGAAIVLNPKNGDILAMVGSKDYFDTEMDGNVNVLLRLRQPGSSIKLINYAYALENGYTPASLLKDSPITFRVAGTEPYSPKNYDGKFRGNISLRSAFAESRNVPAVRTLASYGVDKMVELGKKMGISTWKDASDYGLSLTLGGGDVRIIELATAYATVANYGMRPSLSSIEKIYDAEGKIIYSKGCKQFLAEVSAKEGSEEKCGFIRVLDERVAFMLIDILRDNSARAPAFGINSMLVIPNHPEVAVKTGTSNNLRDNLTVGFNQDYLVATWVGNNDNSPMSSIASGVTGASPIWNKIMIHLLSGRESVEWRVPNGLVRLEICKTLGTLPCTGCPTISEWFLQENKPTKHCSPNSFIEKKEGENGPQIL